VNNSLVLEIFCTAYVKCIWLLTACYDNETVLDSMTPNALLADPRYAGSLALPSGIPGDPSVPVVYLFSELAEYTG